MHHQARLLVDDDDVVVFVDDVQRNGLWLDVGLARRIVEHNGNHVVGFHLVVRLHRLVVHQDITRLGCILDAVARDAADARGQESVDAHRILTTVDGDAHVLKQLTVFSRSNFRRFDEVAVVFDEVVIVFDEFVVQFQ